MRVTVKVLKDKLENVDKSLKLGSYNDFYQIRESTNRLLFTGTTKEVYAWIEGYGQALTQNSIG